MNVNLIGVPLFLGSDIEGVNLGPDKLRELDIINIIKRNNHNVYDVGNINVNTVNKEDKFSSHEKMKYFDTILEVNTSLANEVYDSLTSGCFPFIVGGDHSLGLGTIAGSSRFHDDLAVIWIDAHGDINTYESTPTGNIHGMPLAASMGIGHTKLVDLYYSGAKVKNENVFIIGARNLDKGELDLIEKLNLNLWTTKDIKENGIASIMDQVINKLKSQNIKNIHLSFDIDCLDKALVPGTGTPVSDGLDMEEVKCILKELLQLSLVKSIDFVEFNTLLDENNTTANIAIDLIDWIFRYLR